MTVTAGEPFAGIAGHRRALEGLRRQLASGRLPHAHLLVGENNLGKTEVARRLAGALLPEATLDRHPDFWIDDRAAPIGIDEIRLLPARQSEHHAQTLQAFLSLRPSLGRRRVAVIVNVGRLRDQVQGILLKTLEEPHPGQVLILTSPSLSPFVVLPTVVSRCQRIMFHPLPAHEIEALLAGRGIEPERAALLAVLARGRPGLAIRLAGDPEIMRRHAEWAARLDEVAGAPAHVALDLAAELDQAHSAWKSSGGSGSEAPEAEIEDPLQFAIGSWQVRLRQRMLADPAPGRWARLVEASYRLLGQLEQNVSARLALELFLLTCRRAS